MLLWIIAILLLILVLASEAARSILFLIVWGALVIGFWLFILAVVGVVLLTIFS